MRNNYYPDNLRLVSFCRRTSLHALMLPISLLKMTNFWRKNKTIFHEVFLIAPLFLIFVNKEIFMKNILELELEIFFIISEGFFDLQK